MIDFPKILKYKYKKMQNIYILNLQTNIS